MGPQEPASTVTPTRMFIVVEDNPLFAQLIKRAIARVSNTCAVEIFVTANDAITYLGQTDVKPYLVLVDLGLPDQPGIAVIRRAHERFPDVPIMVISVVSSEDHVLASIRAGARGYILKGDSEHAISSAVSEVLDGHYPISPALARLLFKLAGSPSSLNPEYATVDLSKREIETLRHISHGCSYAEAADKMHVALSTVQSHIRNLYRKLDVNSQTQAVMRAQKAGLL